MRKRRIPWGAVAIGAGVLLFVALLTFPVVGRGECRDSSGPALSVCESWTTSLLGLPTSVAVWAIVSVIAVLVVWLFGRLRRHWSVD